MKEEELNNQENQPEFHLHKHILGKSFGNHRYVQLILTLNTEPVLHLHQYLNIAFEQVLDAIYAKKQALFKDAAAAKETADKLKKSVGDYANTLNSMAGKLNELLK